MIAPVADNDSVAVEAPEDLAVDPRRVDRVGLGVEELAVAGGRGRLAVAQLAQPGVARFAMGRAIDGGSDRRQGDADVAGDTGHPRCG